MMAQICKHRRTNKEISIQKEWGVAGPFWVGISLFVLLCLHIWAIILAISGHN